jgi:hypothetical protein
MICEGPVLVLTPCISWGEQVHTILLHSDSQKEQYLPRNGIATPAQIITAAMEGKEHLRSPGVVRLMPIALGFNMDNGIAKFVTYASFLVDGNQVTNLMSIGGKTSLTGRDPPKPAIVGGLNTHGVFEG